MYGRDDFGIRNQPSLVTGDRHQRHVAEPDIKRLEIGKVLAAVQSGHCPIGHRPEKRKMELVDVEMQNVEFFRELAYPVEHQHVIRDWLADIAVEAQCHRSEERRGGKEW